MFKYISETEVAFFIIQLIQYISVYHPKILRYLGVKLLPLLIYIYNSCEIDNSLLDEVIDLLIILKENAEIVDYDSNDKYVQFIFKNL